MNASAVPNFFVVGAPKAGTTSLYRYLGQHPAIYMSPIKEPAYFASDLLDLKRRMGRAESDPEGLRAFLDGPMTEERRSVVTDWDQYLTLFKNVRREIAVGEASGNYLASSTAPGNIRLRVPDARIVMILRDPVDRLFSQYAEAVSVGQARGAFLRWVMEQVAVEHTLTPRLGAVWNGFYARHLRRYLDCFAPAQVRVYFYEDYSRSPHALLRDLFVFLQVDPDVVVDLSRRHNVTRQPRFGSLQRASAPARQFLRHLMPPAARRIWRAALYRRPGRLTADERARVRALYADDIRELQGLVNRDLTRWLDAPTPASPTP